MPTVGKIEGVYDPKQVEEWVKRFWEENRIYEKVKEWRKGRPLFLFLDGPPYPSSDVPHAGTVWNKVLKDSILRFMRMYGYDVWDKPGYDCHGLPIEVKVETLLGVKVKKDIERKVGVEKFIEACKNFALSNIKGMTKWFKEFGVFMDWDNPYLTLRDEYIEAEWWIVKKAWEKGLLRRELRVVYWCPRCSTTLAEYEVEYKDIEDPSIYVKFRVKGSKNEYLVIWTTTPWTLPANAFVMIHPEATYVKVDIGGEIIIVAKQRLESVLKEAGITEYKVIEEVKGSDLVGLRYEHPLEDIIPLQKRLSAFHEVVPAKEFVTLYEGTGLVHAAPGHGFEDFEVAVKRGWVDAVKAPVDDEGRFTEEAGPLKGLYVREANDVIIKLLEEKGALLAKGVVKHRYPVCWRCKTPVILRATPQWVIKMSGLKEELAREVQNARWLPSWALTRIMAMIRELKDWVLSRQRYWGAPLPVWVCRNCGHVIVVGSVDELVKLGGKRPKELHKPWIDEVKLKCPRCGGVAERVPDVMDVWLDSGVAFYASLGHPEKTSFKQVDFITEGHDQTRGWFFSLLRAGVLGFGKVPYRNVLVHGFMLDEKGREMHKSLGNYVGADDLVRRIGRDPFRFWVLQNTPWEDARFSWRALEQAKRDLSIAWNVFIFASTYMSLDKYDPVKHPLEKLVEHLEIEDKWILSKLQKLVEEVTKAFREFRVHDAVRALRNFILEDVSRWYIRLVRRRVWLEEESPSKLAAYATLYHVLKTWLTMIAPIVPFFAEYLYQHFVKPAEPESPPSVAMLDWPRAKPEFVDEKLEKFMDIVREVIEAVAAARMKAGLKLRQPVRKVYVFTSDPVVREAVEALRKIVLDQANTRDVEVRDVGELKELLIYSIEPVYSRIGPKYRKKAKQVIQHLLENADRVAREILEKGCYKTIIEDTEVVITRDDVRITAKPKVGFAIAETSWGSVAVDTRLTREEVVEGFVRDVVRRIQYMRKLMKLAVDEYIEVYIAASKEAIEMMKEKLDYIMGETRAKRIEFTDEAKVRSESEFVMDWEIGDEKLTIGLRRLGSAG